MKNWISLKLSDCIHQNNTMTVKSHRVGEDTGYI